MAAGGGDDVFMTETMAALLEEQGRLDDALVIYKYLADASPGDERLRRSVERVMALACRGGKSGRRAGE